MNTAKTIEVGGVATLSLIVILAWILSSGVSEIEDKQEFATQKNGSVNENNEFMDAREREDFIFHFDLMSVAQQAEFLATTRSLAVRQSADHDAPQAEMDAWLEWWDDLEVELRSRRK